VTVRSIGRGNRSTRKRKPPTCRMSLTNIMLYRVHPGFEIISLVVIKYFDYLRTITSTFAISSYYYYYSC